MNTIQKRHSPIAIMALLERKLRGSITKSNMRFVNETVRMESKATAIDFANWINENYWIATDKGWEKMGVEKPFSTYGLYLKFLENE